MSKKIISIIIPYITPFIDHDKEILRKHFCVKTINAKGYNKSIFKFILVIFRIWKNVIKSEIAFCWFADNKTLITLFLAKILKKKAVVVVGGYEICHIPELKYGGWKNHQFTIRNVLKMTDRVLVSSKFSRNELKQLCPQVKTDVMNLCVMKENESRFTKQNLIATIGNAISSPSIKYKLKGIETFVQASTYFDDMEFIVIGKYDEKTYSYLKNINPEVKFTGYLSHENVREYLKKAKVYCQLSYRESFGHGLLEAMYFNAIPVVTPMGAMPDVVGDCGFYAEYENVKETVKFIKSALSASQKYIPRKRVEKKFMFQHRENKLVNLINSL